MKRLTLLALCSALLLDAAANSVTQSLLSAPTAASPFVSANINNIGQGGHQAIVTFGDISGKTCGNPRVTIYFEGSFDGTSFTAFGSNAGSQAIQPNVLTAAAYAQGIYKYVRLHVAWLDTTNCQLNSAYYSGGIFQNPLASVQGPFAGSYNGSGQYGVSRVTNPLLGGGAGDLAGIFPVLACNNVAQVNVTAGSTASVVVGTGGGGVVYLCGMVLQGSVAATTFQWISGTGTNCGTATAALHPAISIGTTPFVFGSGLGMVMFNNAINEDICLAAVTGNVTGWVAFARL